MYSNKKNFHRPTIRGGGGGGGGFTALLIT